MRRRTFQDVGLLLGGLLACVAALEPTAARADEAAIVVVVESAGARVFAPGRIRRELSDRLGVPAVPLVDGRARAARGVLSIYIDETGRRASVQFQPRGGHEYSVDVSVDPAAARTPDWLVSAATSVVRASDSWATLLVTDGEILDPWRNDRPARLAAADPRLLPPEVIDPFDGGAAVSEVLDPWAGPADSPARRLSRPTPGRAPAPARR